MIIRADAVIGEILRLEAHPNADRIWLAHVRTSRHGSPVQIVYGGTHKLRLGDLVAVAPPGAKITVRGTGKRKKMRARNYRGQRSHGMLCSLNELGWARGGPNEVAVFQDLKPGFKLEKVPDEQRHIVVKQWNRAIDEADTITIDRVVDVMTADTVVMDVISVPSWRPPTTSGRSRSPSETVHH